MPWMTIREAAEREGVSKRTIRRKVKDGTLQSEMKDGVRLVYLPAGQENSNAVQSANLSQSILEPLFDLYKDLRRLRFISLKLLRTEKDWERMGFVEDSKSEQWNQMYNRTNDCFKLICQMVSDIKIDPDIVLNVFHTIVFVEICWTELRPFSSEEFTVLEEQQVNTVLQEERLLIQRIIGNLRQLIMELTRIGVLSIRFSDSDSSMTNPVTKRVTKGMTGPMTSHKSTG